MTFTVDGYKIQLEQAWKHRHSSSKARQYVRYCVIRLRERRARCQKCSKCNGLCGRKQ